MVVKRTGHLVMEGRCCLHAWMCWWRVEAVDLLEFIQDKGQGVLHTHLTCTGGEAIIDSCSEAMDHSLH